MICADLTRVNAETLVKNWSVGEWETKNKPLICSIDYNVFYILVSLFWLIVKQLNVTLLCVDRHEKGANAAINVFLLLMDDWPEFNLFGVTPKL